MSDSETNQREAPHGEVPHVVEHLFRHEGAKMVATLTRLFGTEHLSLAEDVVQEALAKALQTWPYHGVPQNPSAWIMRVSRNLALDVVRREKVFRGKEEQIAHLMEGEERSPEVGRAADQEIGDDNLRMMFVCCHPMLGLEGQVALALKILCGFSVGEISRAFLENEAVIAKRLTRAKQKIRDAQVPFEIPEAKGLTERLDGVLQTIYLLFNEGYKASSGEKLVREELCQEAVRLAALLAQHPVGNRPKVHALLALMLFNAARLPARVDGEGNLLLLQDQNRALWDKQMIGRAMFHLAQSAAGRQLTDYHLQGAIAACHCTAASYERTDWKQILGLYDRLAELDRSPVVALNRAVAISRVSGPQAGLHALANCAEKDMESYYLYYAVLADFQDQMANHKAAAAHFRKAIELTDLKSEKKFLSGRLAACEARLS